MRTVLIIGVESRLCTLAQNAARLAFEEVSVIIREAMGELDTSTVDLLVLTNPLDLNRANTTGTLDRSRFHPWPVVALGEGFEASEFEVIPPAEWNERLLARVLRSAVIHHELARENARARGDLRTISRRINHDFRTPLGCIFSAAEALQEILADVVPTEAPMAERILDSVNTLARLIDRVSLLAKATSDPLAKEKLDMGLVFWSAMQRLEGRVLKAGASVQQPKQWPVVDGVAAWLEVVWWNLIANALEHGGSTPTIETGWNSDAREYRFWVRDSGNGVPEEARATLFEPFESMHKLEAGKGLGLAIVERLVKLQGGNCGHFSPPEGGSCFFFTLPAPAHREEGTGPS